MPAYAGVDLTTPDTTTDVFTNGGSADITVNVNLCNRNGATAIVRLHVIVSGGSALPANAIEWERALAANGTLERYAITLAARSTLANVNAVCWGA
jgi:hypothetical protein